MSGKRSCGVLFTIALVGLAATGSVVSAAESTATEEFVAQVPALFSGVLPCADCEGIRYDVDLRRNDIYFMRRTYLGRDATNPVDEIGQWSIAGDAELLLQRAPGELGESFAIDDAATLTKLDRDGNQIESRLNYTLTRAPNYAPIEPRLRLKGMYLYMADAGVFDECTTGLSLPLVTEGANAALGAAYARARSAPGVPVLARVDGRIVNRRGVEGEGNRDMLLVDAVDELSSNESCGARGVTHELTDTRWVLVRLRGETVTTAPGVRETFIVLEPGIHRVAGFDGCNRVLDSYEVSGDQIKFTPMANTLMACPNQQEPNALGAALDATVRFRIDGAHLELFDATEVLQARFESRNL